MASLYGEDVLRAPDPRMRAQLGVKRVVPFNGGQLRRLSSRQIIAVDISAGGGYTGSRSIPPLSAGVSGRATNLGDASFLHLPDVRKIHPRHLIDAPAGGVAARS